MSYMYEGTAATDQVITAFSPTLAASSGAKTYVPLGGTAAKIHVLECGFIPLTTSVTSAMTLQVTISSVSSGSFSGGVLVTSGTGTFASGVLAPGAICSVALGGLSSTAIVPRGTVLEYITSGGHISTVAGMCYAVIRYVSSQ